MVDLDEKSAHVLYPIANKPPLLGRSLQVQHSLLLQLLSPTGHITGPVGWQYLAAFEIAQKLIACAHSTTSQG